MRPLQQDDLRWVAGGLCSHGMYTPSEGYAQADAERAADEAVNAAYIALFDLDPNDPADAAAYAAAQSAIDSALQYQNSVYNSSMSYMDVCNDPWCDSSGGYGGQPPGYYNPPPPIGPSAPDGGASYAPPTEGNWLGNALSAVADFFGFDGSFGYDGPTGREWAWQSGIDYLQSGWDALSSGLQQAFGGIAFYAQVYWSNLTTFLHEMWESAVDILGVNGTGYTTQTESAGPGASSAPSDPALDPNIEDIPVSMYFTQSQNRFATVEEAALAAFAAMGEDSIGEYREYAGTIILKYDDQGNSYYSIGEMSKGGADYANTGGKDGKAYGVVVGTFHTHGQFSGPGDTNFSDVDYLNANAKDTELKAKYGADYTQFKTFMQAPTGEVFRYTPVAGAHYVPPSTATPAQLAAHQEKIADLIP